MKLPILTIITVVALLVMIPFGLTFGIKYLPGGVQPSLGNTKRIYGDFVLYQLFISPKDNLTGIGTSLKNPRFANKEDVIVNIYDDKGVLIRTSTLNGKNIEDGKFVKFLFAPILQSKDKKFTWSSSSPTSKNEDALQIFLTENKPSWSLESRVNDKVIAENLSYVTLHTPSSPTDVLSIVYTDWFRKLSGDRYFFIIYITLLLSIFLVILSPISKSRYRNY